MFAAVIPSALPPYRRLEPDADSTSSGGRAWMPPVNSSDTGAAETERRRDELAAILETALDAIIIMDGHGLIREFNPAAERAFGYGRAEVLGQPLAEKIIPPAFRERHQQGLERFLQTGQATMIGRRIEVPAMRRDGTEFPCELTITAITSGGERFFTAYLRDLSERRQLEREKDASERRLRLLFEQAPIAIQIFAPDGATVAANRAWEELFNAPRAHVLGWNILRDEQLVASGASAKVAPAFSGAVVRQPPTRYDWRYPDRPDEPPPEKWIGALFYPVVDDEGRVTEVVCIHDDATERIRSERDIHALNQNLERLVQERTAELDVAQQRYEMIYHANPAAMVLVRVRDERLVEVNDSFCRMSRHSREDALGRTLTELNVWLEPAQREHFMAVLAAEGRLQRKDMTFRRADGEMDHVLISAEPVQVNGEPHLLMVGVDMNARVKAEEELRAALQEEKRLSRLNAELTERAQEATRELEATQERFYKAFHASPAMMTMIRLSDQRYTDVNEAFCRASEHSREEALGRTADELDVWVDERSREPFFKQLREHGRVKDLELELKSKSGRHDFVLVSAEIVQFRGESHLLTVALDLAAHKQAETELRQTLAREKELSRLKSNFVSMVSHEFRTPLGIILSSSEILSRYLETLEPEERADQLTAIGDAVRRMSGLVEQVLVFSRIESGQLEFRPQPLELAALCTQLQDEILSATGHRCPVIVRPEGNLAGAHGDANLIRHVLTNLLTNAVKYSRVSEPVYLLARREGADALFTVIDHGIGIPESALEHLFTAFHRAKNVSDLPGTGLGLVIVRKCLEAHGGEIQIESIEDEGTSVRVRLPLFSTTP